MPDDREKAKRRAERERTTGIDPEDDASRWLAEHDPAPPPRESKSKFKSKALHQWRQREQQKRSTP